MTEDGKKCDICEHDLNVTTEGICYDDVNCEEFKDQKCIKCKKDTSDIDTLDKADSELSTDVLNLSLEGTNP